MNILIGADLVPTDSNIELFASGDTKTLLGDELNNILQNADYRIFNLEVPLTDREKPIAKCGPNLTAPTRCITGYKAMQVDLLTLANNHILDQDEQGLKSTCQVLETAGIAYTGVGHTPEEAAKPYILECDGMRIGVYACAEHEFSIVTEHSAGANPFDPLESPDHVARLKENCDFVIVLYHGGKEHYRYPSPHLQKVCRKLVQKGADLVVCQHSHCIGCEEKYKDGTIVYGQGNFLFDYSESEFWQTSLLIGLDVQKKSKDVTAWIEYYPLVKCGEKVRLAEDKNQIMSSFQKRSKLIGNPKYVYDQYEKFSENMIYGYLGAFSGAINRNLLYRVARKVLGQNFSDWMLKRKYRKKDRLALQNYVECEAHRELILYSLKKNREG